MISRLMRMVQGGLAGIVAGALANEAGPVERGGSAENDSASEKTKIPAISAEDAGKLVVALNQKIERLEARCQHLFDVICSIEKERDRWRQMFHAEAAGHLKAQYTYEEAIMRERGMLGRAVQLVNEYRKKDGDKMLEVPFKELNGSPVGNHREYLALIERMQSDAPTPYDYVNESLEQKRLWEQQDAEQRGA